MNFEYGNFFDNPQFLLFLQYPNQEEIEGININLKKKIQLTMMGEEIGEEFHPKKNNYA